MVVLQSQVTNPFFATAALKDIIFGVYFTSPQLDVK